MSDVSIPPPPFDAPTNPYVTVDQFRTDFPAFADTTTYPDTNVQRFLDVAGIMASPRVWSGMTVFAQELLTAHFLALQQYAVQKAISSGSGGVPGVPGMAVGLLASKSVSRVSVSYDYSQSQMAGWGPFNLTTYGQLYAFYAQMAGTGGFELLSVGMEHVLYGQAWAWGREVSAAWSGTL